MTKTETRISIEATDTPDGRPGYRIQCRCSTHPAGKSTAIVVNYGKPYPVGHVHGTVLMAHHPARAIQASLRSKGIWPVEC